MQDCCHKTRMICERKMWIERSKRRGENSYSSTGHCCCERCRVSEKQRRYKIEWRGLGHCHQWAERLPRQVREAYDVLRRINLDWDNGCQCTACQRAKTGCTAHRESRFDKLLHCDRVHGHEPEIQRLTLDTKITNSNCAPTARQGRACSIESGRCGCASCAYAWRH